MRLLGLVLCALAMAGLALPATVQQETALTLAIRIVPTGFDETGPALIALGEPSGHFQVVATNTGTSTLRLWSEGCSWGYSNLSFEATGPDGMQLRVAKKTVGWEKNFPKVVSLSTGDHMVMEVAFDSATWDNPPVPKTGASRKVTLRAIYESAEDKDSRDHKVWSGKIISPEREYIVTR